MTYHCNATGTKVTPDKSGRSQALWLHCNGESPPESTLGTGTGGHTGRLGTLDDRRGSFRRVQLWPEALANSELVNSTSCVVLRPSYNQKHPLFHINHHSPTSSKPVPRQFVKMVQYYTVFGAKVGSHYVSACALRPTTKSRDRNDAHGVLAQPIPTKLTFCFSPVACNGCLGRSVRRHHSRYARWRQQACSGSPNQRIKLRRGRLHQVLAPDSSHYRICR